MKATLLIFNTLSNPEWEIEDEDELFKLLRELNGTLEEFSQEDMGYRGIELKDKKQVLTVCKGMAQLYSPDGMRRFLDINRDFEKWLIKNAKDKVCSTPSHVASYEKIATELGII